jgi:hypothetical protein
MVKLEVMTLIEPCDLHSPKNLSVARFDTKWHLKYYCISSEVIHNEDISQVDANGCAVCPDCHKKIKVGTAGVQNMHKKHRSSQNCKNTIAKKHREKKNLKNSTLDGFLRPKPAFVMSTVQSIPLIRSFPAAGEGAPIALPLAVNSGLEESKLLN